MFLGEEDEAADNISSDGATPAKQAEQVMAIYPVVAGQKPSQLNMIPPRASSDQLSRTVSTQNNDLIDVDQNHESPSSPVLAKDPVAETIAEKHDSTHSTDIQELLEGTGQKADGPLIDFAGDLKKELPKDGQA